MTTPDRSTTAAVLGVACAIVGDASAAEPNPVAKVDVLTFADAMHRRADEAGIKFDAVAATVALIAGSLLRNLADAADTRPEVLLGWLADGIADLAAGRSQDG